MYSAILLPISVQDSSFMPSDMISPVLKPSLIAWRTAFSTASASSVMSKEYRSIIAAESIVAIGLALF